MKPSKQRFPATRGQRARVSRQLSARAAMMEPKTECGTRKRDLSDEDTPWQANADQSQPKNLRKKRQPRYIGQIVRSQCADGVDPTMCWISYTLGKASLLIGCNLSDMPGRASLPHTGTRVSFDIDQSASPTSPNARHVKVAESRR